MKEKLLEIFNQPGVAIILTSSILIGFISGLITALNYINRVK